MPTELLSIQPGELKFPFELKKQISSSLRLVNSTNDYVAFKVKTTSPKKYCVRPNTGIVQPHCSADVIVTMQAQREALLDMQCKDKFLVQSVLALSSNEVTQELFNKEEGKDVHEVKLKVLYVSPPQPPSPISESIEEESNLPKAIQVTSNGEQNQLLSDLTAKTESEWKFKLNEAKATLNALTEERNQAVQQSQTLHQQLQVFKSKTVRLDAIVAPNDQKLQSGFSLLFVVLVGMLGMLVGYFLGGAFSQSKGVSEYKATFLQSMGGDQGAQGHSKIDGKV